MSSMPTVIPIAHDFSCGWCYLAIYQVPQLEAEFGVQFDWIPYELFPDPMPFSVSGPPEPPKYPDKPKTPSRFALASAAQGVEVPKLAKPDVRTRSAHIAAEFIRQTQYQFPFIESVYRAYFERAEDIGQIEVMLRLAKPFVFDLNELKIAIESDAYSERIVPFDEPAYATGVYNLPNYWIGGERYAEQPMVTLRKAIARSLSL